MLHKHTFAPVSKIIQFTFIAHVFYSAVNCNLDDRSRG